MWSEKLIEQTKEKAWPGAMMKKTGGKHGMMSCREADEIKIVAIEFKDYMPFPTDEVIASYKDIDAMIADGWVID